MAPGTSHPAVSAHELRRMRTGAAHRTRFDLLVKSAAVSGVHPDAPLSRNRTPKQPAARTAASNPPRSYPRSGRGAAPKPSCAPGPPRLGPSASGPGNGTRPATCQVRARSWNKCVEHFAVPALVKHARAGSFLAREFAHLVVVVNFTFCFFALRERDMIVKVEIAAVRRHPLEAPAHALLECLDLCQRRT